MASASSASGSSASRPVRTASISSSAPRVSPSRTAPARRPSLVDEACGTCRRRVGDDDLALALGGARRDEVDAHHLELRRGDRAGVGGVAPGSTSVCAATCAWSWIGATMPWTIAAVLGALADREHARVRGHERVVDDDPALDVQARRAASADVRADADRDDDEVAVQLVAAGERRPATRRRGRDDRARVALEQDVDAERLDRRRQQRRRAGVELALHQAVHEVHDRRRAAQRARARRRPRARAGRRR